MYEAERVPPYTNRGAQNTNGSGLRACVDWLQATFLHFQNPFDVCTLLGIDSAKFEAKQIGKYGYSCHLRYDYIAIYYDSDHDHVHLEMSGQGCRQYESLNIHSWTALFGLFFMLEVNITRLDLAVDDFKGYFKIPTLYTKLRRSHATSKFKEYRFMTAGKIAERVITGNTLYLGSPTSRLMVRFYDKLMERQSKGIEIEDGLTCWNRTELQLRDERALAAATMIAQESFNIGQLISGILKNYVNFRNPTKTKDGDIDKNKSRWKICEFWTSFLGDVEPIALTQVAPDKTIETTKQWFEKSITPSLAVLMEAFDYDIDLMNQWLIEGKDRLSDRHKNMLKRYREQQRSIEDIKKDQFPKLEN